MIRKASDEEFDYLEASKEALNTSNVWILRLNDPRVSRWDMFIIILAIYNCFSIPFQTAFEPEIMESYGFLIFNTLIDLCFFLDIVVTFRTTFYD